MDTLRLDRLLTAAEVAERLAVSKRMIYRLAAAGDLPHVRLGPETLRFDPAAVEAWLRERAS